MPPRLIGQFVEASEEFGLRAASGSRPAGEHFSLSVCPKTTIPVENFHEIVNDISLRNLIAGPVLSFPVIGYPDKSAVDFSDPETRCRLSPSAIRVFTNIAEKWNLSECQVHSLLGGIASSTLHAWKSDPDKRVLDKNAMTRISLIIGIYKALHTYFGPVATDREIEGSSGEGPAKVRMGNPPPGMISTSALGLLSMTENSAAAHESSVGTNVRAF